MSRATIPYSGRIGTVCDECHQPDEVVEIHKCWLCGQDLCESCAGDKAGYDNAGEFVCEGCVDGCGKIDPTTIRRTHKLPAETPGTASQPNSDNART